MKKSNKKTFRVWYSNVYGIGHKDIKATSQKQLKVPAYIKNVIEIELIS